jgi:DNA phosphorothioation-dependent restriction protein DptF
MRFKEALSVMSMASPYAVSTERHIDKTSLHQQIKQYLYIQMPIEKAVTQCISSFGGNGKKYEKKDTYLKLEGKLVRIKFARIK